MRAQAAIISKAFDTAVGASLLEFATRRWLFEASGALAIILVVMVSAAYAIVKPDYNWDMIAYTGAALENRYSEPAALHAETWRQIEGVVPPDELEPLMRGDAYREAQWTSPDNFQSQLSMYRVKAGYIAALRLIEPFAGVARGSMLLSVFSAVAFGAAMIAILARFGALQAGVVVAPVLMLAGFGRMTSSVSPDLLLAVASLGAIYAWLRGKDWLVVASLVLSVVIRPDNIVFVFALLIAAILFGWRRAPVAVSFALSLVAGVLISKFGEHPGWWAHFYFSCVEMQSSMAGFQPDFSLGSMLQGYARGILLASHGENWPFLLALMLVAWVAISRIARQESPQLNALVFAMAIGSLGKFAYFPLPDDRFFFNLIALMALALAILWKPRFDLLAKSSAAWPHHRTA